MSDEPSVATRDRITAIHEAAHAVVSYRSAIGSAGERVSIVATSTTLGHHNEQTGDGLNPEHVEGRILSCYAGGHAERRMDPLPGDDGTATDDRIAGELLSARGWTHREQDLRDRSAALVDRHWTEIVAVADELLRSPELDGTEVELIADAVCGDPDADVARYRAIRDRRRHEPPSG